MRAQLWNAAPGGAAQCGLCSHSCRISDGAAGRCGVRLNRGGVLHSAASGLVTAVQLDPVEKKPLYHFLPGSRTFSVGSAGCNFSCRFCQNHHISQAGAEGTVAGRRVQAAELMRLAEKNRAASVAFTYNEPTVFFELAYEAAGMARARGLRVILVSNGYMTQDFLLAMRRRVDAINVDLKSFSDDFYKKLCGARLQPVLDNLRAIRSLGWWLEVTTLIIPGLNDSADELRELAAFIRAELGQDTPWHVTAFHGAHQMADHPPTPLATLELAWRLGREAGLNHVYIGNAPSPVGANTFCPQCGAVVIERQGFSSRLKGAGGKCPACGAAIAGVWQ